MHLKRHLLSIFMTSGLGLWSGAVLADERPVALIESIENAPDAEVQIFDYVYKGDKIDLRPQGVMVLAYFDSCAVERITGGKIKMQTDKAKLEKDAQSVMATRACRTAVVELDDDASEVGAAVKRVSPFDADVWQEWAINTTQPIFKWPYQKKAKGDVSVRIYDADAPTERLIWQTTVPETTRYVIYPESAPPLSVGKPYRVTAAYEKKYAYSSVFSYDPDLEIPDGAANRLVPLDEED